MLARLWLRLLIGCIGLMIGFALFVAQRCFHRDVRWAKTPTLVLGVLLVPFWIGFEAADRMRISSTLQLNFWGLFWAHQWLKWRYKQPDSGRLTKLGLTDAEADADTRRSR